MGTREDYPVLGVIRLPSSLSLPGPQTYVKIMAFRAVLGGFGPWLQMLLGSRYVLPGHIRQKPWPCSENRI